MLVGHGVLKKLPFARQTAWSLCGSDDHQVMAVLFPVGNAKTVVTI